MQPSKESDKNIFSHIFKNIFSLYRGRNLLWQILFVALTYLLVSTGFDWDYYQSTRSVLIQNILFPSAIIGFFVPVFVPVCMLAYSKIKKNFYTKKAAFAVIQSEILGLAISSFYKVFTGRPGPHHLLGSVDISHVFRFGILRGGAFQGWPSSHTATAFAMSVALVVMFPKNKLIKYSAVIYAIYIGFGVSATIHWFSDFAAGAILGTIIGISVAKSFIENKSKNG